MITTQLPVQREHYPVLTNRTMLASCSQSALSQNVLDAIDAYKDNMLTEGMNWHLWMDKVNAAREKFARIINCQPEDVAILASVSDATSSLLNALDLNGKSVAVTDLDFPCIGQVLLAQQKRQKFTINYIPHDNYTIPLEYYENFVEENTAITCVPHVAYYNGFKQDLKAISDVVHKKGSLLFVDAYQSAGSTQIDVEEMGIDILVAGIQKYLLGVPGISFMYIRKEVAESLNPPTTGWFGQKNPFAFQLKELNYAAGAQRFNTGTPPVINAYIADAAFGDILSIGVDRIEAYLNELSGYTVEQALKLGFTLRSPIEVERKAPTTAIYIENASEVEDKMKDMGFVVSSRQDVIRIAPHIYNTREDIDAALAALLECIA